MASMPRLFKMQGYRSHFMLFIPRGGQLRGYGGCTHAIYTQRQAAPRVWRVYSCHIYPEASNPEGMESIFMPYIPRGERPRGYGEHIHVIYTQRRAAPRVWRVSSCHIYPESGSSEGMESIFMPYIPRGRQSRGYRGRIRAIYTQLRAASRVWKPYLRYIYPITNRGEGIKASFVLCIPSLHICRFRKRNNNIFISASR